MRSVFTVLLTLAALSSWMPARAAADENWSGAWAGAIGRARVTVCRDGDLMLYYYDRHRQTIRLSRSTDALHWDEIVADEITGRWTVLGVDGETLTGRWTRPDGSGALPIRLERLRETSDWGPCGWEVFYGPLRTSLARESRTLAFEGKRYRLDSVLLRGHPDYRLDHFVPVERQGHSEEAHRRLLRQFEPAQSAIDRLHECRQLSLGRSAMEGRYIATMKPVFWTRRWLTLETGLDETCPAAPIVEPLVFRVVADLGNGTVVHPADWLRHGEEEDLIGKRYPVPELIDLLRRFTPGAQPGRPCHAAYAAYRPDYEFLPGADGMQVNASLRGVADEQASLCADTFTVPYEHLLPFATPAGKEALRSLQRGD